MSDFVSRLTVLCALARRDQRLVRGFELREQVQRAIARAMLGAFHEMLQLAERVAHLRARFVGKMRLPRLLDLRFEQRKRPAHHFLLHLTRSPACSRSRKRYGARRTSIAYRAFVSSTRWTVWAQISITSSARFGNASVLTPFPCNSPSVAKIISSALSTFLEQNVGCLAPLNAGSEIRDF